QLFDQHNHHAFYGFWLSVVVLHWLSVVVCVVVLRRNGIGLTYLGVPDRSRAGRTVALPTMVGLLLVVARSCLGPFTIFGGTPCSTSPSSSPDGLRCQPPSARGDSGAGIPNRRTYRRSRSPKTTPRRTASTAPPPTIAPFIRPRFSVVPPCVRPRLGERNSSF